jgi:hypothetical protein
MIRLASLGSQWRRHRVALACLGSGLLLLGCALNESVQRWRIMHGRSAQARVLNMISEVSKGRPYHRLAISFTNAPDGQYWLELPVTPQQFKPLREGGFVTIRYQATHPAKVMLATESWLRMQDAAVYLVALSLCAAGLQRRRGPRAGQNLSW